MTTKTDIYTIAGPPASATAAVEPSWAEYSVLRSIEKVTMMTRFTDLNVATRDAGIDTSDPAMKKILHRWYDFGWQLHHRLTDIESKLIDKLAEMVGDEEIDETDAQAIAEACGLEAPERTFTIDLNTSFSYAANTWGTDLDLDEVAYSIHDYVEISSYDLEVSDVD